MLRKNMVAKTYKVLKEFVFRGIQYKPGASFDPVKTQCAPVKLGVLMRQRKLGDEGPSLAQAIKEAQAEATAKEQDTEAISDGETGDQPLAVAPTRRRRQN